MLGLLPFYIELPFFLSQSQWSNFPLCCILNGLEQLNCFDHKFREILQINRTWWSTEFAVCVSIPKNDYCSFKKCHAQLRDNVHGFSPNLVYT